MPEDRPELPFERRRRERAEAAEAARQRAAENSTSRVPAWLRSYMDQLEESQRTFRGRGQQPSSPSRPSAPTPAPAPATTRRPASGANFPGETVSEAAPIADYEERMRRGALPAGRSAAPGPMGQYEESAAAGSVTRPRPRPRPAPARPRGPMRQGTEPEGTEAAADAERERQREAAPSRGFFERLGIRRTNETGMDPATIEQRRNYLGSGAADTNVSYNKKGGLLKAQAPTKKQAYKKGGMVKPKGHGMKEEAMEMKGGRYRGGMKEEMAEMAPKRKKGPMPMMKKGGAVKAPAKKMKSGGKVAPKKMMGGGRAMYAKGGMARGCK